MQAKEDLYNAMGRHLAGGQERARMEELPALVLASGSSAREARERLNQDFDNVEMYISIIYFDLLKYYIPNLAEANLRLKEMKNMNRDQSCITRCWQGIRKLLSGHDPLIDQVRDEKLFRAAIMDAQLNYEEHIRILNEFRGLTNAKFEIFKDVIDHFNIIFGTERFFRANDPIERAIVEFSLIRPRFRANVDLIHRIAMLNLRRLWMQPDNALPALVA